MLGDHFANAIYPEGTEEEKTSVKKILESALEGNLCIRIDECSIPEKIVADNPEDSFPAAPFCRFANYYYLQKNWVFETRFLNAVRQLLSKNVTKEIPLKFGSLNAEQQEAVKMAFSYPLTLITGGPGTGKTYTAASLVAAYLQIHPESKVAIAAPTGKAVSRLESAVGSSAHVQISTLHALLKLSQRSTFLEEGGVIDADLILVDECSMVDASLFSYLLASIPQRARVVLMGDGDQLPPVESGSFFMDLIESGKIPCARLKESLRSNAEILSLAKDVNMGNVDAFLSRITSCDLKREIRENFPGPFFEEPQRESLLQAMENFKILSCIRSGPLGVDTLNESIFRSFWTNMQPGASLAVPILITRNDYNLGLFNGDTGVLVRTFPDEDSGYAYFPGKKIPKNMLSSFEYAYALSVHKSQGSEYKKVLLLVPPGSEVFGKEVLYTAVTRAKETLIIDGDKEVIRQALLRSSKRLSGFNERF